MEIRLSSPNLMFPRLKLEIEGFLRSPRTDRATTSVSPIYLTPNSPFTLKFRPPSKLSENRLPKPYSPIKFFLL